MIETFAQPTVIAPMPRGFARATGLTAEAAASLGATLAPHWLVERVIDPDGEVCLVVMAADDDPAMPTYLLHDRDRVPHVATIADDVWKLDRSFGLWPDAITAVVTLSAEVRPPSDGAPPGSARALQAA